MRNGEEKSRPFARKLRQNLTRAETILWSRLKDANRHGYHFRRQHPIGPYIVDFAVARQKLVVEVDGATHGTDAEIGRDERRDAYLRSLGWRVVRVPNVDIYADTDATVEFILAQVPPPSRGLRRAPPPP